METDAYSSLRGRVLGGIAWKVLSQLVRQSSRIAVAVVLARLLTPHDYGLAAMVLVFSSLVLIFADLALGAALVQRERLSERDRSTVFWTSLVVGVVFTLGGVGLAGPLASFYGEPDVRPLFIALSLGFVVTALGTTQSALLNREMNFRSLELRMMAAGIGGGVVGIAAALRGYGAWALIAQQLTIAAISTSLLWSFSPWRPRLTFSFASLRDLGGFSGNVFGTRVLFYANRNVDNLLIGRFLGPAALGAYAVAYNVMLAPLSRVAAPVQEVLFPAFSRMQHEPARMAAAWLRVNRLVGAITIPGMLGLIAVAPEFVRVVLGGRWDAAVPVVQILAWVGLLQSLQRMNSSVLQARDRTRSLLWYACVALGASLLAFVIGLQWGIVGVAAAYAVSSSFVEPYYTWLTARALDTSPWAFLRVLSGIAQAAAGMLVCVLALRLVVADLPAGARLALLIGTGIVVYVPLCRWRAPEVAAEIRGLRGRRARPQAVAAAKAAGR